MQALESPGQRTKTFTCAGTITKWSPKGGWGLICIDGYTAEKGADGVFYAHYSQFLTKCGCGEYLHRCLIQEGMEVEFSFTLGTEHRGPFMPANEIRIRERH